MAVPWPPPTNRTDARSDAGRSTVVTPIPPDPRRSLQPSLPARVGVGVRRAAAVLAGGRGSAGGSGLSPARARTVLPAILAELAAEPAARAWQVRSIRAGDPALTIVGPASGPALAVVRVAESAPARRGLATALEAQTAIPLEVPALAGLIPRLLGSGTRDGLTWLAEAAIPGVAATSHVAGDGERARTVALIGAAAAILREPAAEIEVGHDELERWVDRRISIVGGLVDREDRPTAAGAELALELTGRRLRSGWIHGDLWAANAVLAADGSTLVGLVDWDSAARAELALQDTLHLVLTTRRRAERRDLGPLLAGLLGARRWEPSDVRGLGVGAADWADPDASVEGLSPRTALLLAWLRFVEANVTRHPALGRDRRWVAANVETVVRCL